MASNDPFQLNPNATIFNKLHDLNKSKSEEKNWWQQILQDEELYVNVRKYDCISVYYKSLVVLRELKYNDNTNELTCYINPKYLGEGDQKKIQGEEEIKEIVEKVGIIKNNIDKYYDLSNNFRQKRENKELVKKTPPAEGKSEGEIKGELYTNGGYIDTEYAFIDKNSGRIDLTAITEEGMIEFVELKCISDPRLLHKEGSREDSKIIWQMKRYNDFIVDKKVDEKDYIKHYYEKVQLILKKIGVENPLANVVIKGVAPKARLLFAPYLDGKEKHPKRMERVQRIAELLKDNAITSNIDELLEMIKD